MSARLAVRRLRTGDEVALEVEPGTGEGGVTGAPGGGRGA